MTNVTQNNMYCDEHSDDVFYIIGHKTEESGNAVGNTPSRFSGFSFRREGSVVYVEKKGD